MDYGVPYTLSSLMELLGLKSKESARRNYIHPAIKLGLIQMTISDKPQSRNQRYIKKQLFAFFRLLCYTQDNTQDNTYEKEKGRRKACLSPFSSCGFQKAAPFLFFRKKAYYCVCQKLGGILRFLKGVSRCADFYKQKPGR